MAFADNPHVERVLLAVETISGDHDRAVAWLQEPLATFDGKTALELVTEGRTDAAVPSTVQIAFLCMARCDFFATYHPEKPTKQHPTLANAANPSFRDVR